MLLLHKLSFWTRNTQIRPCRSTYNSILYTTPGTYINQTYHSRSTLFIPSTHTQFSHPSPSSQISTTLGFLNHHYKTSQSLIPSNQIFPSAALTTPLSSQNIQLVTSVSSSLSPFVSLPMFLSLSLSLFLFLFLSFPLSISHSFLILVMSLFLTFSLSTPFTLCSTFSLPSTVKAALLHRLLFDDATASNPVYMPLSQHCFPGLQQASYSRLSRLHLSSITMSPPQNSVPLQALNPTLPLMYSWKTAFHFVLFLQIKQPPYSNNIAQDQ